MLTCNVQSGVVQFCGLVSMFLVRKMGDLALHSALDARLETKKKKNLPDAVPRDAEVLPLWEDIAVGNWLW